MHRILSLIVIVFALISCKNEAVKDQSFAKAVPVDLSKELEIPTKNGKVDTNDMAKITFDESEFNFGEIEEGTVVKHEFKFKNTGKRDLMLLYHKATCGCTVPEFSKQPYPPGASGKITIVFDSKGKKMSQNKKVKIFTNTIPNMTTLTMKGYVKPKN